MDTARRKRKWKRHLYAPHHLRGRSLVACGEANWQRMAGNRKTVTCKRCQRLMALGRA